MARRTINPPRKPIVHKLWESEGAYDAYFCAVEHTVGTDYLDIVTPDDAWSLEVPVVRALRLALTKWLRHHKPVVCTCRELEFYVDPACKVHGGS